MAEIKWTEKASYWLQDIHDYIAKDNPKAARKVSIEIKQKAGTLKDFPQKGYLFRETQDGEVRVLLYGHYRIVYQRYFNHTDIHILGVFHGKLDIDRYLS